MRTLIAWDNSEEADLLQLYLGIGDNEAVVCLSAEELLSQARQGSWDAVLMALAFPKGAADSFVIFQQLQAELPTAAVVIACRAAEMVKLPRYMSHGLRFHLVRDAGGDFVFLLLSTLESAVEGMRAEESRKLAERLREEMEGVRKLQESIIPRGITPPPGYALVARYEPSQVTVLGDRPVVMAGGDYYNIFCPDEQTLVVLIGDASGHGLKACMAIMAMHTLVRMIPGDHYRDTAAFVSEINCRLCENSIVQSEGGFITLFYAAIDTKTHTMKWTSAGHPLAQLQRLQTNEIVPIGSDDATGLPLAVLPEAHYAPQTIVLPPASRVLLYSDGLTDAFAPKSPNHEAFGLQGITDTLRTCRDEALDQSLERLFRASTEFTRGAGRHDDTSAVLMERLKT